MLSKQEQAGKEMSEALKLVLIHIVDSDYVPLSKKEVIELNSYISYLEKRADDLTQSVKSDN